MVNELRDDFDYILLDSPAGIEQGFQVAIAGADRALVVTTPEISAVRDADRVIGLLFSAEINDIKLIVNRIRPDMIRPGTDAESEGYFRYFMCGCDRCNL